MEQHPESKKTVSLYDHMGRPFKGAWPAAASAKFYRGLYYKGPTRVRPFDPTGASGSPIQEELVRAQVPQLVTLLVYRSKFDISPLEREYYVYAPQEQTMAAELALRLWQRWEKPPREEEFAFGDMNDMYPKVGEGAIAEPLTDEDYDEHWADVRKRAHRAAGDPSHPFAFTCLDNDVRLYKIVDRQAGHIHKLR